MPTSDREPAPPVALSPRGGGPHLGRRVLDRSADRRITQAGLAAAGGFLVLAIAAAWLPPDLRRGAWLPLHLALAGAASQAIAAAMPFFTAALLASAPAAVTLRGATLLLLGLGALGVSAGVAATDRFVAAAGGLLYLAGAAVLALVTFAPLRASLGRRYPIVLVAYATAMLDLSIGAGLGTLQVAGFVPVLADWLALKPAHAWLNLLGFVTLVIAGTLVHLYPTVVGTRIQDRSTTWLGIAGLCAGPLLAASGYVLAFDPLTHVGALAAVAGAVALAGSVLQTWRARGRWTTDPDWHRLTSGHLLAGVAWLVVAMAVAAGRILSAGAGPAGWSVAWVAAPLAVGWMAQSLLGAWSHLQPAIGPGDPTRHAWQRRLLGRGATFQLVAVNTGTALLAVGLPAGADAVTMLGAIVATAGLGLGLGKLALAGAALEGGIGPAAP